MNRHAPLFPEVHIPGLAELPLTPYYGVEVIQPELPGLSDLDGALAEALGAGDRLAGLPRGARVAVAVGSRGIAGLPRIVRGTVDGLRARGLSPFIVPAMGSHGGGTAEGQTALLAKLGVGEKAMGAPVVSSMETVDLGEVAENVHCHLDCNAAGADGIVVIARVKPHTNFDADIESGLCKMVSVGLGKAEGARNVHAYGRQGLLDLMPRIAALSLAKARFLLGLAVVENSAKEVARIEGVAPESFMAADRRLLALAKDYTPRLPFEDIDLLVVEEIGKEISGTGMDNKVVGRVGFRGDPPRKPQINSTVALRVTAASQGNGIGVGNADIITREAANGLDLMAMYFNAITSSCVTRSCIPPVMPTEKLAIKAGQAICWQPDPARVRGCVIKSSSSLRRMLITAPLLTELQAAGRCGGIWRDVAPLVFAPDERLQSGL